MFLMKDGLKAFAESLRKFREELGYSKYQMAQKAKLQQAQYGRYEAGLSAPTLQVIVKIADALNVAVDDLIGRKTPNSDQIKDLELLSFIKDVDQMDYGTRLFVKEILESVIVRKRIEQKKAS